MQKGKEIVFGVRKKGFSNDWVVWDGNASLRDIIKTAEKEFPGIPFKELNVTYADHDNLVLVLQLPR
ncbi:MAG: hypothetical protein Q8R29_00755 [bacterium]|nr:hypothetical protein [bacterium]